MAIALGTPTGLVGDNSSDSGETLSHNNGAGSDRVTVGLLYTVDLDVATTMEYNGVAMIEQAKIARELGTNRFIWVFTKFGTSTGTNAMVAAFSPNSRSAIGAVTVTGANQSDTLDDTNAVNQSSGTSISLPLTASVAGCVAVGITNTASSTSESAGTNTVLLGTNFDITNMWASSTVPIVSSGSYTLNVNYTTGGAAFAGVMIAPVAAVSTANNSARRMLLMQM